ncbi:hypothetical protein A6770_22115 [Nostoc minutum NIES-26]|uniref:eCIS core domain-containing protein n=1 Tax=Nostoc minutum NIES-26 TaxID=1844469 RepID=A0A367QZQ6_9NOSO|nr:hypothetical protein A6770_22115 [Nostoc minutum NIES-26]
MKSQQLNTKNSSLSSITVKSGILQRQCDCGQHTIAGSKCETCQQQGQAQLRSTSEVPASVYQVLRSSGEPLDISTRTLMESRFGHDFSRVRVHTDAKAADSAKAVNALAYTVGQNIVFDKGQYAPETITGKKLIAHELTHTVQQQGVNSTSQSIAGINQPGDAAEREADQVTERMIPGDFLSSTANVADGVLQRMASTRRLMIQRKEGSPETKKTSAKDKGGKGSGSKIWDSGKICNRDSRENIDFPNTYIRHIKINLGNLTKGMTLEWENPKGLPLPTGGYQISPGAGLCCLNCDDVNTSRQGGSLCTPKVTGEAVHDKGCVLSSTSWAKNPTYFSRSGIAIHAGPLPKYPASHGCVRTEEKASEIVHDNSRYTGETRTLVTVSGTWKSSYCYKSIKDKKPVKSSEQCRPKPKVQPLVPTTPLKTEKQPIAEVLPIPEDTTLVAISEIPIDGAGPA